jgi:hypothetical protein
MAGVASSSLSVAESRALFWVGVQGGMLSNVSMSLASGEELRPAVIGAMTNEGLGALAGEIGDDFFNSLAYPMNISARVATGMGTGAASSAITRVMCGNEQRSVVPIRGSFSVASAVVGLPTIDNILDLSRDQRHAYAENYVRRFVMHLAPEMILPASQQNFRWQLERFEM